VRAQPADPYRLQIFSSVDRTVAAVGEPVRFEIEGLAVPESDEAAEALLHAFDALVLPPVVEEAFELAEDGDLVARRRAGTRIFELSRAFVLRPRRAGTFGLPPVPIPLPGVSPATSPRTLVVYEGGTDGEASQRAVVPIVAEGRVEGRLLRRVGSGFFVAEDALVTAYHVVLDAERVRLQLPDGRRVTTARAWAVDPARDVAVLYVPPGPARRAGVRPLRLTDRFDADLVGDAEAGVVFTAGWPGGIQQPTAAVRYPSLRYGPADLLRVSANAVRPGDSGGPLLDADGRVLGVVSSGRSTDGEPDVLREDLCLATDPRRALAARLAQAGPMPLRRSLRAAAEAALNDEVIGVATRVLDPALRGDAVARQLERLDAAARQAPDDPALQFLAGTVYQALGRDDRAATAYHAVLDEVEGYFPALYALGHVYYERGDHDRAEDYFRRTHQAAPYARLAALALARLYADRLRYDEADGVLREVLDHDPDFGPALYLLGYGLAARGRSDEAEAVAVRLDRLDAAWADALRLHLRHETLRPVALARLPRVDRPRL
jgi:Flp pilus assembly protein TadD